MTNNHPTKDDIDFTDPKIEGLAGNVVPIQTKARRQWLAPIAGAAAIVMVAGAGYTLVSSQQDFTQSTSVEAGASAETATSTPISPADGESADAEFAVEDRADSDASDDSDAFDDDTASDESAEEAESASPAPQAGEEEAAGETIRSATDPFSFDEVPTEDQLEEIVDENELVTNFEPSPCALNITDPEGGTMLGYLPISVDGVPGEILVFASDTNSRGVSVVAVDSRCQPLS